MPRSKGTPRNLASMTTRNRQESLPNDAFVPMPSPLAPDERPGMEFFTPNNAPLQSPSSTPKSPASEYKSPRQRRKEREEREANLSMHGEVQMIVQAKGWAERAHEIAEEARLRAESDATPDVMELTRTKSEQVLLEKQRTAEVQRAAKAEIDALAADTQRLEHNTKQNLEMEARAIEEQARARAQAKAKAKEEARRAKAKADMEAAEAEADAAEARRLRHEQELKAARQARQPELDRTASTAMDDIFKANAEARAAQAANDESQAQTEAQHRVNEIAAAKRKAEADRDELAALEARIAKVTFESHLSPS